MNQFCLLSALLLTGPTWAQTTGFVQTGQASFYASKFEGRRTASGETFRNSALTAAHLQLPFGSRLRVTHLGNGRSVVVRVNDRGPFSRQRILDLSQAAARQLNMIRAGTARVRLEVISDEAPAEPPVAEGPESAPLLLEAGYTYSVWGTRKQPQGWGLQVGSFREVESARQVGKQLIAAGLEEVYLQAGWAEGQRIYRVLFATFPSREAALAALPTLQKKGFEAFPKAHF